MLAAGLLLVIALRRGERGCCSGFEWAFVLSLSNRAIRVWRAFFSKQLFRENPETLGLTVVFRKKSIICQNTREAHIQKAFIGKAVKRATC